MPIKSPPIKRKGRIIQPKKMINPIINIKISAIVPITIKNTLIKNPKTLEIKLEKNASKNLFKSNPLPEDHEYLRQGENKVFKSRGIEK